MEFIHTFELQPSFGINVKFYDNVNINDDSKEVAQIRNERNVNEESNGVKIYFNLDLVPGIFTILTAANKTVSRYNSEKGEFKLKTNSIASEFLYNLSPFTSITNALKAFGMDGRTTKKVGIIHFYRTKSNNSNNSGSSRSESPSINATLISIQDAFDFSTDNERYNRIKKYCKLSNEELSLSTIDDAFASHITMRDVK